MLTLAAPSVEWSDQGRAQALIGTDPAGKILSEELAWIPSSRDFLGREP